MKHFILILLLFSIFLCGCSPSEKEDNSSSPTVTESTVVNEPSFEPYVIINTMTLEQKVGQLFLARCPNQETGVIHAQKYHLGGYLLFGNNFEDQSIGSMQQMIDAFQEASSIPMLIAVDEEGGTVCRVSSYSRFRSNRFPSPRSLYEEGGIDLLLETEREKCLLLKAIGINVNMAPVCDITTDSGAFMYSRSLGLSPDETGACITQMVQLMSQYKVGSVLKHFPGYGNNSDTHTDVAVDMRTLDELKSNDLVPFQSGMLAGCGAVLVSHTIIKCLDTETPASLSPNVIHFLREDMGYDGVIMTDDLKMAAIANEYGTADAAVLAVLAGNDLLCSANYQSQYNAVLEACKDGRISESRLEQSVARILTWKYNLGLLDANV